jgi:DNA-binding beta-propeller fold protein YncE
MTEMGEWWKDPQLISALQLALDTAGIRGLKVGYLGVRITTDKDEQMTLGNMCSTKTSSIRKDTQGFDIYLCSPSGAFEVFIHGDKPPVFLPLGDEKGDLSDINRQLEEFGNQLRRGLPLEPLGQMCLAKGILGSHGEGDGQFSNAWGVAVDESGNIYVTDTGNDRVQKFNSSGQFIAKWGSRGSENGQFDAPRGIAVDGVGNVYVTDSYNNRIQKFSSTGTYLTQWGNKGSGNGQFKEPFGVAVDGSGNVYVADSDNHRVQKFSSLGVFQAKWGIWSLGHNDSNIPDFGSPCGIAVNIDGNVYVLDTGNRRIQKFDGNSSEYYGKAIPLAKWGTQGSGDGQFNAPFGVAVDGSGNVYVADTDNDRVQKFKAKCGSRGSGKGQFMKPSGIAIDRTGSIYVVDNKNNRIQKFSSSGENQTALETPKKEETNKKKHWWN